MKFYKENNINPAASCLPLLAQFPVFIALYLDAQALLEPHHRLVAARRPEHHRQGHRALVGLRAARDLRRLAGRLDVLHGRDDGQDAAQHHDGAAARLHHRRLALPDGPDPLLDDDEPVDGRPGARHAPARAEDAARRSCFGASSGAEAQLADAGEGRRRQGERRRAGAEPRSRKPATPQPRRVKRKKGGARR